MDGRLRALAIRSLFLFLLSLVLVAGFWYHREFYQIGFTNLLIIGGFVTFLVIWAARLAMNLSSVIVLLGVAADGWPLAFPAIRGRRPWLQSTFAACALSFLVVGAWSAARNEGVLPAVREDLVLGLMLLTHALTAILVLGLIHGEALPRRRAMTFLLLVPVPLLAYLAPIEGWTVATAYEGTALGGFLVLCLGIALGETIFARHASPKFALRTAEEEAGSDRPTLIVARDPPKVTTSGVASASFAPNRHAALRTVTTVSEFLASAPGGFVVLEDLADLSVLSGWRAAGEVAVRLRHVARDSGDRKR